MIKNVKIWIGENNEEYSRKVQEYLFSQGAKWNTEKDTIVRFTEKTSLFAGRSGEITMLYGNYDKSVFDSLSSFKEMKLIETVSYSLEEVIVREKICIGEKNYYIDELEVALKNIKPI
jgi:hypothetical protein